MFGLSSRDWRFLDIRDGLIQFQSKIDGTLLNVSKVKFYNPEIDGAVTFEDGRIRVTQKTLKHHQNITHLEILGIK